MRLIPTLIIILTLVITDPYQGIDYDKINVYDFTYDNDDDSYSEKEDYPERNYQEQTQEFVKHYYDTVFDYYNR